jgi:hypothetical protein
VETLILQPWTTVSSNVDIITQSASSWLDVKEFEDLVLFLDCKEQGGLSATINYQMAPARDDKAFVSFVTAAVAVGTTVTPYLAAFAAFPVARFIRWQLKADGAFDMTFRIFVAAYSLD